jgi:hypothetical protein
MARRSRSDSTSPNTILVIFLVLFILLNIGFGVWIYTLSQSRDNWDKAAQEKDTQLKAANAAADWSKYRYLELANAIGIPDIINKSELVDSWRSDRKLALAKDQAKFQGEPDYDEFLRIVGFMEDKLGGFAETGYRARFAEIADPWRALAESKSKLLAEAERENKAFDAKYRAEQAANLKEWTDLKKIVAKGNADSLAERQKQNDSMTAAFKQNEDLRKEIVDKVEDKDKEIAKLVLLNKQLGEKLKTQVELASNPNRNLGEPHALMLDISRGKALWDLARGKITRVDDEARKVYIDKGLKDGMRPGLTFTVFARGLLGRGEGPLKATIEVVRVESDHTSQCKVNSYYDVDGSEIPAGDATPGKILRDGTTSLKEGDQIFNMFWGAHVALAGIVDFSGSPPTDGPSQMDALKEFMRHLERMGMVVDAYVDLQDGTVVGALSSKTNYLIRGANSYRGGGGEKGRGEPVVPVNDAIKALKDQAVERGMFIISPLNFAVVTGYRRPGSLDNQATLEFRPSRPTGGNPTEMPNDGKGKQLPPMPPGGDK